MNKLNKPKAFKASESITTQSGIEIANLLRSGIKNQTVILVANNQKWHEIEIESLRIDEENFLENSHLESAAHYIDTNNISLSDMGVIEEEVKTDYDLKHEDFLELSKSYPGYNETQIFKLHEYEKRNGLPHGKYHKKQTLQMLTDRKITINEYIREVEERKHAIINAAVSEALSVEENVPATYEEVVNTDNAQHSIEVETVPVPADSVSLQIFKKLTPEKITELQGLRITQEEIVKSNPVIVITNKTTYAQAKKTAAILLSASTAIDGNKGVEATATKYLNTFKTMLKTALGPIAKITREPYDKQKKLIEDWDNRISLQVQNRIKLLTAIPFAYNSENDTYFVGSLIVTQKDLEELTVEAFHGITEQGKAIKIALESVKSEQDAKIAALEKRNEELAAILEKFLNTQSPVVTPDIAKQNIIKEFTYGNSVGYIPNTNPFEPVFKTVEEAQEFINNNAQEEETEQKAYSLPHPDNKLLNELDLAHVSVLEEKQYIECREYYAQALQDAADAINDILVNPDKTVQKSVAITELIKTWKL